MDQSRAVPETVSICHIVNHSDAYAGKKSTRDPCRPSGTDGRKTDTTTTRQTQAGQAPKVSEQSFLSSQTDIEDERNDERQKTVWRSMRQMMTRKPHKTDSRVSFTPEKNRENVSIFYRFSFKIMALRYHQQGSQKVW